MKDIYDYLHNVAAERGWDNLTTTAVICNFLESVRTPVSGFVFFKIEDLVHFVENLEDAPEGG